MLTCCALAPAHLLRAPLPRMSLDDGFFWQSKAAALHAEREHRLRELSELQEREEIYVAHALRAVKSDAVAQALEAQAERGKKKILRGHWRVLACAMPRSRGFGSEHGTSALLLHVRRWKRCQKERQALLKNRSCA